MVKNQLLWAVFAVSFSSACAVRQPGFQTYRLVARNSGAVLVPPGIAGTDVVKRTFMADVKPGPRRCKAEDSEALGLQVIGKRVRITVRPEMLNKQSPGWLSQWAAQMEARECIAAGAWWNLANQVAESVPLNELTAFRLRYEANRYVAPQVRIQVDSPILKNGTRSEDFKYDPTKLTETATGLHIDVKSSDNLLGWERAWYCLQQKQSGNGFRINPISAEQHINGMTEQRAQPSKNYFLFSEQAGYYRLVQKQEQTKFTALVVAGRTFLELEERSKTLESGDATCELVPVGFCVAIPKGVAANLFLPVAVNGKEILVHWGAGVGDAIQLSGEQPSTVLSTLTVTRVYYGKPVTVEFDHAVPAILGMRLSGGETISWH